MKVSRLIYPEGIDQPSEPRVKQYRRLIWENSEVCNNCFRQIRDVGDVVEKRTKFFVHETYTHYQRTGAGSQEYAPHVPAASERYGQCFCLDCGADTRASDDELSIEAMTDRAVNLVRYLNYETDEWASGRVMARTIKRLKGVPSNQGYDTEIFCVATIEAIDAETERGNARAAQTS